MKYYSFLDGGGGYSPLRRGYGASKSPSLIGLMSEMFCTLHGDGLGYHVRTNNWSTTATLVKNFVNIAKHCHKYTEP